MYEQQYSLVLPFDCAATAKGEKCPFSPRLKIPALPKTTVMMMAGLKVCLPSWNLDLVEAELVNRLFFP